MFLRSPPLKLVNLLILVAKVIFFFLKIQKMQKACVLFFIIFIVFAAAHPFSKINGIPRRPRPPSMGSACGHIEVPDGTIVSSLDDQGGVLRLEFPNGTVRLVPPCRPLPRSFESSPVKEDPNQWLAWYLTNVPTYQDGVLSFSAVMTVPDVPRVRSNLCFFPGLQPTYNPRKYDFIIQPVLAKGNWVSSSSLGWMMNSVMCHAGGYCTHGKAFDTTPGNRILGSMVMESHGANYVWNITSLDLNTGKVSVLRYDTPYMLIWAFVAMEHYPAGRVSNCDSLPSAPFDYTDIKLNPPSLGGWLGTIGTGGCNINVNPVPGFYFDNLTIFM